MKRIKRCSFIVFPLALAMGQALAGYPTDSVCVWSEDAVDSDNFTFLGSTGLFDGTAWTAEQYYSWHDPFNVSYNGDHPSGQSGGAGPDALSNVSQLFFVKTSDAPSAALFVLHDATSRVGDNTGGWAGMTFQLSGDTDVSRMVEDDLQFANDFYGRVGDHLFTDHIWDSPRTDGVVYGDLSGGWEVKASFYKNLTYAGGSLFSWQVTRPDGSSIALPSPPGANWSVGWNSFDLQREVLFQACGAIDLKPGSNPNCVNTNSGGMVSVAILTTDDFDALTVDESTIEFGGQPAARCAFEDAGYDLGLGDGDIDLVCKFKKRDIGDSWPDPGMDCGWVELTAELFDGTPFAGVALACLSGEPTCESSTPTP